MTSRACKVGDLVTAAFAIVATAACGGSSGTKPRRPLP